MNLLRSWHLLIVFLSLFRFCLALYLVCFLLLLPLSFLFFTFLSGFGCFFLRFLLARLALLVLCLSFGLLRTCFAFLCRLLRSFRFRWWLLGEKNLENDQYKSKCNCTIYNTYQGTTSMIYIQGLSALLQLGIDRKNRSSPELDDERFLFLVFLLLRAGGAESSLDSSSALMHVSSNVPSLVTSDSESHTRYNSIASDWNGQKGIPITPLMLKELGDMTWYNSLLEYSIAFKNEGAQEALYPIIYTSDARVKAAAIKVMHQWFRFQAPGLILGCIRGASLSGQSGWGLTWSSFNLGSLRLDSRIDSATDTSSYLATNCLKVIHLLAPIFSWLWDLLNRIAYWLFFQSSLEAGHSSQRTAMVSGPQGLRIWLEMQGIRKIKNLKGNCRPLPQIVSGHEHAFGSFCT